MSGAKAAHTTERRCKKDEAHSDRVQAPTPSGFTYPLNQNLTTGNIIDVSVNKSVTPEPEGLPLRHIVREETLRRTLVDRLSLREMAE